MPAAPLPPDEGRRLRSLKALRLLDTDPEERFDRVTRLARRLFGTPIALVSLVDSDRQWFKSEVGLGVKETPREDSFCAHAILEEGVMIVADASEDERFRENPLVLGFPQIRFYAGCPVRAPDGSPLGTLCVIDHEPRDLEEEDETLLSDLAALVEEELRARTLANMDELTGLTNRRGFRALAAHTLALCRRVNRPATLLLFDLDDFKAINDTLGHAEGDRVLKRFGAALLETFRDSDVVARLGGDEFCVLLSGTKQEDAAKPLELLGERLGSEEGTPIPWSVGTAEWNPLRPATVVDLVAEADTQLYRRKRGEA